MTVTKTITKKIISKGKVESKPVSADVVPARRERAESTEGPRTKPACFFCKSETKPSYTDVVNLRRYLSERSQIVAKEKSGVCARHQRGVSSEIKHARHLALLPFVPKI